MVVATLTQIPIQTRIQMYSLSVNKENFSVAFLLFVSFFSSSCLYDALFFWPYGHHHVVLLEKQKYASPQNSQGRKP